MNLSPAAAPPDSHITVSGSGFEPNLAITIVFDGGDPALAGVTTSAAGTFSLLLTVPDAPGADHAICARIPNSGDVCAGFRLLPKPSPSATPSPQPSPSEGSSPSLPPTALPSAPASPAADPGTSPLAFISRPPFVFFPLLIGAGLIGWLAYYLWSVRPSPRVQNVTVVHRAAQPRAYLPPVSEPERPPVPPASESPTPRSEVHQPPSAPEAPKAPGAPSAADVPPDLPTPSD